MSRVALVTGAAGGIGSATVRALVEDGYSVVGLDLLEAPASDRVIHIVGDVRDRQVIEHAVGTALDRWGRLDAAVAAAAVIRGGHPLWEAPVDELTELLDVDVRGVWNTAAVTVPVMLASPEPSGCRFVAMASAAGTHGLFHLAAYSAAKHAVVGLVKALAADLVATGVTAVGVAPGSARPPLLGRTAELYGMPDPSGFTAHQLLHRVLEPEEIGDVVAFCCSAAGGVLNGSVVHADGGFRP